MTSLGVPSSSILSRDPCFQETIKNPGETAGFLKERWLKRMRDQPLEQLGVSPKVPLRVAAFWLPLKPIQKGFPYFEAGFCVSRAPGYQLKPGNASQSYQIQIPMLVYVGDFCMVSFKECWGGSRGPPISAVLTRGLEGASFSAEPRPTCVRLSGLCGKNFVGGKFTRKEPSGRVQALCPGNGRGAAMCCNMAATRTTHAEEPAMANAACSWSSNTCDAIQSNQRSRPSDIDSEAKPNFSTQNASHRELHFCPQGCPNPGRSTIGFLWPSAKKRTARQSSIEPSPSGEALFSKKCRRASSSSALRTFKRTAKGHSVTANYFFPKKP